MVIFDPPFLGTRTPSSYATANMYKIKYTDLCYGFQYVFHKAIFRVTCKEKTILYVLYNLINLQFD
jgi:hypothetical protein